MKRKSILAMVLTVLLMHSNLQAFDFFFMFTAFTHFTKITKTISPIYSYLSNDLFPKLAFWRFHRRAKEIQASLKEQSETLGQHSENLQTLHNETGKVSEQVSSLEQKTDAGLDAVNTRLQQIRVEGSQQHEATNKQLGDIKGEVVQNKDRLEALATLLNETETRIQQSAGLTKEIMLERFEELQKQQKVLVSKEEFESILSTKLDGQCALFQQTFEEKSQGFNATAEGLSIKMTQIMVLLLGNNCTISSSHRESILQKAATLLTERQQGSPSSQQQSLITCR